MDQTIDPDTGAALPAKSAALQVYFQAKKLGQEVYSLRMVEIYRIDTDGSQSSNIAIASYLNDAVDICTHPSSLAITDVPYQSTNLGINTPFNIEDSGGAIIATGCTFQGTYINNRPATNALGGSLQCDNNFMLACESSYFDNQRTRCGQGQLGVDCQLTSGNCLPYYERTVLCKM